MVPQEMEGGELRLLGAGASSQCLEQRLEPKRSVGPSVILPLSFRYAGPLHVKQIHHLNVSHVKLILLPLSFRYLSVSLLLCRPFVQFLR